MENNRDLNIVGRRHPRHSLDLLPPRGRERSLRILFFRNRFSMPHEINVHAGRNLQLRLLTPSASILLHRVWILVCCKMSLFI